MKPSCSAAWVVPWPTDPPTDCRSPLDLSDLTSPPTTTMQVPHHPVQLPPIHGGRWGRRGPPRGLKMTGNEDIRAVGLGYGGAVQAAAKDAQLAPQ